MKLKKILNIILVLFLINVTFVFSTNDLIKSHQEKHEPLYPIYKGWNLISDRFFTPRIKIENGCVRSDFTEFTYLPILNKYVSNSEHLDPGFIKELKSKNPRLLASGSHWVYSSKFCDVYLGYYDSEDLEKNTLLFKGWNFLSFSSDMFTPKGSKATFKDYFGSECNVEGIYVFWPHDQEWSKIDLNKPLPHIENKMDYLGLGLLVKVSNECHMATHNWTPEIPQLPN